MSTLVTFRLYADFPHGALLEVFGVITAANPQTPEALRAATGCPARFSAMPCGSRAGRTSRRSVVLPGSDEPRVSFAVIENLSILERLMRDFIHPGSF
jgi:hypothetical protein